jgi:hypothetical protein
LGIESDRFGSDVLAGAGAPEEEESASGDGCRDIGAATTKAEGTTWMLWVMSAEVAPGAM